MNTMLERQLLASLILHKHRLLQIVSNLYCRQINRLIEIKRMGVKTNTVLKKISGNFGFTHHCM